MKFRDIEKRIPDRSDAALRDAPKSITLRIFIVKGDTFIRRCRQLSGKGLREADPNTIPRATAFSLTTMRLFVMQLRAAR